jgi:hypothetical protein
VYGCPARAAGNAVEDTVAHVVHALEKQFDGEEGDNKTLVHCYP